MGIHGLWPLLEATSTAITLDALEGKRLAIDVSFWLYQAQQGYNNNNGMQAKNPHLMLMLNRIAKLLFYKIRPVFVFDGENVPRFKKQLLRDRCLKRHLKEIVVSRGQKKRFEQMAKEQLSSVENSLDGFNGADSRKKTTKNSETPAKIHWDEPSTSTAHNNSTIPPDIVFDASENSSSSEPEDVDNGKRGGGIYSSTLDAQIYKLEERKERVRNAKLQPWEIPQNSGQFSRFQLERLVKRNQLSIQLDKLRSDRVRNTVQLKMPVNGGERKLIVMDKQMRTHVLTRSEEIQIIESENVVKPDLTWPQFVQLQTAQDLTENDQQKKEEDEGRQRAIFDNAFKNDKQSGQATNTSSSSDDDDDFIEVSDLEEGGDGALPIPKANGNSDDDIVSLKSANEEVEENDVPVEELLEIGRDGNDEEEEDYFRPKNPEQFGGQFAAFGGRTDDAEGVYADCQKLLTLLGLPFMQAPAEAEAQCVELERLKLVDGVVSDDSDVWLFGVQHVYKNMFSRKRDVQKYNCAEIQQKLGLGRCEFIQLGMLAGGDYSRGLDQVGMVAALELVSEFVTSANASVSSGGDKLQKAFVSLKNIREWILAKRKADAVFIEPARRIRLRKIIETNNSDETIKTFPNEEVFQAYAKPLVDSSSQKFRWKRVDFSRLERFLDDKLGLPKQRVDQMTHGAFQRWDQFMAAQTQSYQPRITDFARQLDGFGGILGATGSVAPTERVQKALARLKGANGDEHEKKGAEDRPGGEAGVRGRKMQTKLASKNDRKRAAQRRGRRAVKRTTKATTEFFTLSEESSSSSSSS